MLFEMFVQPRRVIKSLVTNTATDLQPVLVQLHVSVQSTVKPEPFLTHKAGVVLYRFLKMGHSVTSQVRLVVKTLVTRITFELKVSPVPIVLLLVDK